MATNATGTSGAATLKSLGNLENPSNISPWRFAIAPMMDFADSEK
jgi:hypothetical protein